jgi:anti-repressor protein
LIADRIESFGFVENVDFLVVAKFGENPLGGRPSIEYALTLDMAKELAMVERNAKGKQARQWVGPLQASASNFESKRKQA